MILGTFVLGGFLATLAVILGLIVRSRDRKAIPEFASLRRPENASDFPRVAIVIPARNEERNIASCLEALLALDYPNFEILVVDDASTDGTSGTIRDIIARKDRPIEVRLIAPGDVPVEKGVEWISPKSRALWQGAQRVRGEFILFLDADTQLRPDALWRAVGFARGRNLQALSMSGVFVNPGFWGDILEGVMDPALFLIIPWRRVNSPGDPAAWMNGNFILYDRAAYFAVGGHRAIAGSFQDDLALALHSKAQGVRFLFQPLSSAYQCRDYIGFKEAYRGWTRRLAAGGARLRLGRSFYICTAGMLFLVAIAPLLTMTAGLVLPLAGTRLFGLSINSWALIQTGLVIGFQGISRRAMHSPVWRAVFAPVGAALAIAVTISGYRVRFIKKVINLRGRALPFDEGLN